LPVWGNAVVTANDRQFEGADREHAKRTIALAKSLSSENYLLAKYIDDETGLGFSSDHLRTFARKGFLPNEMHLKPRHLHLGWRIDARPYKHGNATPDTPWFYQHCFLQYYGVGPISGTDFLKIRNEWRHMRTAFGETLYNGGDTLLRIAHTVHADPKRFEGVPFIDIRCSKDYSSDYLEFLAFADGYWLHVFLTDAKQANDTSIITISFTPRSDDAPARPPEDSENLLTSPTLAGVRTR
jgi:hypothetical protein